MAPIIRRAPTATQRQPATIGGLRCIPFLLVLVPLSLTAGENDSVYASQFSVDEILKGRLLLPVLVGESNYPVTMPLTFDQGEHQGCRLDENDEYVGTGTFRLGNLTLVGPSGQQSREAVFTLSSAPCGAVRDGYQVCTAAKVAQPDIFSVNCFDAGYVESWSLNGSMLDYTKININADVGQEQCSVDLSQFGSSPIPKCEVLGTDG